MIRIDLRWVTLLCLLFFAGVVTGQATLYVRANSSCTTDCGGSWAAAYANLQDALTKARNDDTIKEVRVAGGTYRPAATNRTVVFNIPNGITLTGGYKGNGEDADMRDPQLFPSILSGDLLGNDGPGFSNYEDNSLHVVMTLGVDTTTVIDGFTIYGGNADLSGGNNHDDGGGWYNTQYKGLSSPLIRNCIFTGNQALRNGGAFYSGGKFGKINPAFVNCTFTVNRARTGGAIYSNGNSNEAAPVFSRCLFTENQALGTGAVGGVIYSFARAALDNEDFYAGRTYPKFDNCIFAKNFSEHNAGTLYFLADGGGGTAESFALVQNCSFYANDAGVGGAVYLNASHDGMNEADIQNCIFWDSRSVNDPIFHYSSAGPGEPPVINVSASLVDADNCDHLIPAGAGTVNCSDLMFYPEAEIPMFVDAENGDFHLDPASPAVNAGSNALVSSTIDFDGQERIQQGIVDMGADEREAVTATVAASVDTDWRLYPNPTRDQLQISCPKAISTEIPFQVFDLLGRSVLRGKIQLIAGAGTLDHLDRWLPPGTYLLRMGNRAARFVKLNAN